MTENLILVDASGFAFRAFYSASPRYRPSDGEPTGAIEVFMSIVWRMLGAAKADAPTMGAAVFDAPGKNFRHALFPAYKANRDPARRKELDKQFPIMRTVAEVLGLAPVECDGFEADDVIATLAYQAMAAGIRTTIVSSDKDFSQCLVDGSVSIVDAMQKVRRAESYALEKFGVEPHLVPDVQALAGDDADGIPGIPGLGLIKAAGLVRRFGSLEGVLENAEKCRWPLVRRELVRNADKARLYLKLTTLRHDVPIAIDFETLRLRPVMKSHLLEITRALEAEARFESIFGLDPQMVRVVERVKDPLAWWREEMKASGQPSPDEPQCGFYKRKLIRGGPWVPARIWRTKQTDPITGKDMGLDLLRCEVDGKSRDPLAEWTRLSMYPVKESEFKFETADIEHAKKYRPGDPKADTTKRINLLLAPTPKLNRRRKI